MGVIRIEKEGYYYHVMARGQRKNPLFFSDKDKYVFLQYLKEELEETDIELYAYCLMRNHFHLLIRRGKDDISKFMHHLNLRYAIYLNNKYNLVGHVFQGRYKSFIILSIRYLHTIKNYIHQNPVKAGYVINEKYYKFSSADFYNDGSSIIPVRRINYAHIMDFDYDKIVNIQKGYIGTRDEFLTLQKRERQRNGYKDRERREIYREQRALLIGILKSHNLSLKELKYLKHAKSNVIVREIMQELSKEGVSQADIARLLDYSASRVCKALRKRG
ncbi:MAG: transposase [candidate division WOR-3 bacterium]|nr:transposase [candidate division WOR-3 bacterium]